MNERLRQVLFAKRGLRLSFQITFHFPESNLHIKALYRFK